jgi:hypothetical protein
MEGVAYLLMIFMHIEHTVYETTMPVVTDHYFVRTS